MTAAHTHFSVYDSNTGLFVGRQFSIQDVERLALNLRENEAAVEGQHDHLSQKVDLATGKVVDHHPPQPSPDYEWSATTRRWVLSEAAAARNEKRAAALARIAALEASQARPLRELVRDPTNAEARKRIDAIDDEISKLREALA